MLRKDKQLENLIKYLILTKMIIKEQNGTTQCKNCGIDFEKLIDTLVKIKEGR